MYTQIVVLALAVVGVVFIKFLPQMKLLFQNGNGNGKQYIEEWRRKDDVLMERLTNNIDNLKESFNRHEEATLRSNDRLYEVLIQIKTSSEMSLDELRKINGA